MLDIRFRQIKVSNKHHGKVVSPLHLFLQLLLGHHRGRPRHCSNRRQDLPLSQSGADPGRDAADAKQAVGSDGGVVA